MQLLTARQVAQLLNIRVSTVYALCRRGEIPYVRLTESGRRPLIRFCPDDLQSLIRRRSRALEETSS